MSHARRGWRRRPPLVRRIRRSPVTFWTAAVVLALVTGGVAHNLTAEAAAALRQWGDRRTVAVATGPLDAGTVIAAGDAVLRDLPVAVVAAGAVSQLPVGRVVTAAIAEGEPILFVRLAPEGQHGLAALLPAGARAVAIPVGVAPLSLLVGDTVDVLATFDPTVASAAGGEPTFAVASHARVIAVADTAVTVAVDAGEVTARRRVALAEGQVTLALTGTT